MLVVSLLALVLVAVLEPDLLNRVPWSLLGVIAPLALLVVAVTVWLALAGSDAVDGYVAALVLTAPLLPGLAVVCTTVAYLSWQDPGTYLLGTVAALLLWFSFPTLYRRFTSADRACTAAYGELCERLNRLESRSHCLCPVPPLGDGRVQRLACEEAKGYRKAIKEEFEKRSDGVQWVLGTGYIKVWRLLHRAEEALIEVEPREVVISGAAYDELRLRGFTIANRDSLLTKLTKAVEHLSKPATVYLEEMGSGRVSPERNLPEYGGDQAVEKELQARAMLREVRHTINEFRDDSRAGLIRARNRLVRAVMFTGATSYLLVGLAIFVRVDKYDLAAAAAYYLVGGVVGLFAVLRQEARADHAVDDYGLATARLVHTPLLSGLAAIGGVVLVLTLMRQGDTPSVDVNLETIFDLKGSPYALIVAAVFGLTPGLLIDRLRQQTDGLKGDLQDTKAANNASVRNRG